MGGIRLFEDWANEGVPKWNMLYLWYTMSHYRPGIGWVKTRVDGRNDFVWCLLRK